MAVQQRRMHIHYRFMYVCVCVCVRVCTNVSLNVNDHWLLDLAEPISSSDLGGKLDRTITRGIQNVGREHSLRSNTINPVLPS